MKKYIALLAACLLVLSLAGCAEPAPAPAVPPGGMPQVSVPVHRTADMTSDTAASEAVTTYTAQEPCLLTSGGQSADYQMIGTVMGKLGLDYSINNLATSADLGEAKTLIVVVGGSSKGLGAAGIDADDELARVGELIDGAKQAGLSVIAMHTGGTARRGDLSDKFIGPVFEKADYAIVVSSGDEDGMMMGICEENSVPMDAIASISEVASLLPGLFRGNPAASADTAAGHAVSSAFSAQSPILLTSGGQSADYQMIGTVMTKLGMEFVTDNLATSANLGDAKTLIVVVGGSSKGLGAAGIDADDELARVGELIDGAKQAGLSVIAMHTGGTARRGDLSDKFIGPVFSKADYAIVVSSGDEDGMMKGICEENNIPLASIASISEVVKVLPPVFEAPLAAESLAENEATPSSDMFPVLLTSGGQSADYQMIGTVMTKLGMEFVTNNLATSSDLGDAKTLIVVVGGSSKGLGAAGIDADDELARVGELIDGAKSAGLKVIAMHTGGTARRGDLSDKFIGPVFEKADYAIVVSSGDEDGMMKGICEENNIPLESIASISEVTKALPALLQ